MGFRKLFNSSFFRSVTLAFGLVFVTLAVFCSFLWNEILEYAIERELELSNSSKSFGPWMQNPAPFFIDFYFFNWTNPSDLKEPGYKPKFEEAGPYRFREEIRKADVQWNENKTVTYRKLRRWHFEPTGSKGSLNDVITSLNVIALTAARSTRHWNKMARIPLSVTLSATQKLDTTKQVRQLLFEGFADPLIDFASKIPGLSSQVPFDKFGWFYKRNDSSEFDGVFNVETGARGMDVLGKLKFWNFNNRTPFYEGHCGDVEGSAGDFWPPQRTKTDKITLFSPDMCRYIHFMYSREKPVHGVKGYRYDSGSGLFDNGTKVPDNECFCGGKCYPSGVVNVSSCRFGAPAFVSYPHFHMADPVYLSSVEGLNPEPGRHDTYIILEQKWGIPLEVAIRLQINILVESDPGIRYEQSVNQPTPLSPSFTFGFVGARLLEGRERILKEAVRATNGQSFEGFECIRMFDGLPTIFFPMIWFEQKVTVPEYTTREIRFLLDLPWLGFVVSVAFYLLGFSCLAAYGLSCCLGWKERR